MWISWALVGTGRANGPVPPRIRWEASCSRPVLSAERASPAVSRSGGRGSSPTQRDSAALRTPTHDPRLGCA
ncbi:hypothetical protein GS506_00060 [Rhodococcus hoagii]|nr:hypothetical protein [Prescottella equi]